MNKTLIGIEDASVFIPGQRDREYVLLNIDWQLREKGHCAITGANGAGKSTFLNLAHGSLWADKGRVFWLDANGIQDSSRITGLAVTGLVSPAIHEDLQRNAWNITVQEMLRTACYQYRQLPQKERDAAIRECLIELNAENWLDLRLSALSQGQMRLALLAREILRKPRVLLLDEFASGLDAERRKLAFAMLDKAREWTTFVFTAHRLEEIPAWTSTLYHMESGRLRPFEHTGRQTAVQSRFAAQAVHTRKDPLFELDNVSVYIDRELVLKNINWHSAQGEHWRISGANGSGKSTFLRLLAGDELAAAGGRVRRWSSGTSRWAETLDEIRQNVCLVSDMGQTFYGYPLTGLELVCSGFDNTIGIWREIGESEKSEAFAAIEAFFPNAAKIAQSSIRRLSTGQLRKLHLARALMSAPSALLLDEPCTGLDAESRGDYLEMLSRLAVEGFNGNSPAIIFVSHYDADVPEFIKRHARLENGFLQIIN